MHTILSKEERMHMKYEMHKAKKRKEKEAHGIQTCSICGRPIYDKESIERGIGPECYRKTQVKYSDLEKKEKEEKMDQWEVLYIILFVDVEDL